MPLLLLRSQQSQKIHLLRIKSQKSALTAKLSAEDGNDLLDNSGPKTQKNPKKNQDVSHKQPLADQGTNKVENLEPKPHSEHMQEHMDAGDFKRWGARRSPKGRPMTMTKVNMHSVIPYADMAGKSQEETSLLHASLKEAREYIEQFKWCHGVKEIYYGIGIGGVVAVFLFQIDAPPSVDEWLWVVVGDLPSCYLVTDDAETPASALRIYCNLMEDWTKAVLDGKPLDDVFSVQAAPTKENANQLAKRVELLRDDIIPAFEAETD